MVSKELFKSARSKIDRASQHIAEANKMLQEERPFRYVFKTDAKTGRRTLGAEANEPILDAVSTICGDALHNLRSAIDHAYTEIVAPRLIAANMSGALKKVQFPFSETAANLEKTCLSRQANQVSPEFVSAIMALKPYRETGGNQLLAFLHYADIPDKHAHLIPIGYSVELPSSKIRTQVPELPIGLQGTFGFGRSTSDIEWYGPKLSLNDWVIRGVPVDGILKQDIKITVNVTFDGRVDGRSMLVVPTLHRFVDVTQEILKVLGRFK